MSKKVIKYFFELVFIFVIPLLILVINCNYENTIEYDNNGNFQSTEKHIEFTAPFSYKKDVIYNFTITGYSGVLNSEDSLYYYSDFIAVDNIIYLFNNSNAGFSFYYYDSSQEYIGFNYLNEGTGTTIENNNIYYFRVVRGSLTTAIPIVDYQEEHEVDTIWGRLKNVFIDSFELQDNFVIDFIISYTILWFMMFIIWHIIYVLFDKLFHIRKE